MKKIAGLLVVCFLTLGLSACGLSPKETLLIENKELLNANSLVADYMIKAEVELKDATEQEKMAIESINNSVLSMKHVFDEKQQKDEITLGVKFDMKPYSVDTKLPFLVDGKKEKVYIDSYGAIETLKIIFPLPEDNLKGKIIEVDLNDKRFPNEIGDLSHRDKEVREIVIKEFISFFVKKNEEDFQKDNDKIMVHFSQKELKNLMANISVEVNKLQPKNEQLSKDELNQSLDEFFNNRSIKFDGLKMVSTIKDKKIVSQDYIISLIGDVDGRKASIKFIVSSHFDKINEKVEFKINPSKNNIITLDELETLLNN